MSNAHDLADVISGASLTYHDEDSLQLAIFDLLTESYGVRVYREKRLDSASRIDLLAGSVGIEVKLAGSTETVTRQLMRYAHSTMIDELILVTTKAAHNRVPEQVAGVPVIVVSLIGAGLL